MSDESPKEIFIKNEDRNNAPNVGSPDGFQTEYERLNRQPVPFDDEEKANKIGDFKFAQRRPEPQVQAPVRVTQQPRKVLIISDELEQQIPKQPLRVGTVSGYSHERAWDTNRDNPNAPIHYDDVPDVPSEAPPLPREEYDKGMIRAFNNLPEGTVAVLVGDDMIECSSVEEAEGVTEELLFSRDVSIDEISIIHKLTVRVGVSVK